MSAHKSPEHADASPTDYRMKQGSAAAGAWKWAATIGVAGLLASGFLARSDFKRFAFSYLFALFVCLTIALGSLFFVVVQFLTKAWWSVSVRRTAEFFMMGLPAVVVLMIPLLMPQTMGQLFPWIEGGAAAERAHHAEQGEHHDAALPKHQPGAGGKHEAAPPKTAPSAAPAKEEHSWLSPSELEDETATSLRGATAQAAPAPAPRGGVPAAAAPPSPAAKPGAPAPAAAAPAPAHPAPHAGPGPGVPPAMGGPGVGRPPHGGPAQPGGAHREPGKKALEEAAEKEEEEVLAGKRPYLNRNFFWGRQVAYGVIWILLALRYFRRSVEQDETKSLGITASLQQSAPLTLFLFGLSITFAAFDWLMSLTPMWYSTIFGVCIFAGSVVSSMAVLVLATLTLNRAGLLGGTVSVEHYHDLGKLLFGWLVFWAYVTFSQFFLIWYANIPEELAFFHMRWTDNDGTWKTFAYVIVGGHFAFPFWLLMSRNVKRRPFFLGVGAFIILVMHILEIYWLVLPNVGAFEFQMLDLTCLLGIGGVYLAAVLYQMQQHRLIPVGDPRLPRALKFENA